MKRYFLISAIGFIVLFFLIRFSKHQISPDSVSGLKNERMSDADKEKIKQFWSLYYKATEFRLSGDWRSAAAAYDQALELEPNHKDALYYSGNVLYELNEFEAAARAWRKLTQVNPLSKRAHVQLGTLYSCGVPGAPFDLTIAEKEFKRSLEINKEESGTLLKLGGVYILMGKLDLAEKYLEIALKINFKSSEAAYLLGYLNWESANFQTAKVYLSEAARILKESSDQRVTSVQKGASAQRTPERKTSGPISFFRERTTRIINPISEMTLEDAVKFEYLKLSEEIKSTISHK